MRRVQQQQWARSYVAVAWRYEQARQYPEALRYYGLALQTSPDYPERASVYERMARCSTSLGPPDYWRARGYYLRAAEEYAQRGDLQGAARCREYAALQEGLAQIVAEKARLQEAQLALEERAQNPPQKTPQQQARERYETALAAFQAGRTRAAAPEAEAARRLDPRLAEARYLLGLLYEALGRYEEARQELYAFVTLKPDHALAPQAISLLNRLSQLQVLFFDDFEQGGQAWASVAGGAGPTLATTPQGEHYLSVGPSTRVYARFPTLTRGAVELHVWTTAASADLDVVLLDETAGARPGMLATPAALRITFTPAGVFVNGVECMAAPAGQMWHRLGVGLDGGMAVVSLDGAVARSVPHPYGVTSLELIGRGLQTGARPACIDNVRVTAAAAAPSAPPS
jgi:Tfp pilus assembly protein PilF